MASIFGHAVSAIALSNIHRKYRASIKFITLAIICAILPDTDVLAFKFNIPYESQWGHRGFTHSIAFSIGMGIITWGLFYRKNTPLSCIGIILLFTIITLSHPILDAMTTGGKGVALFWPLNNERIFLPWRPIKVSPIGAARFFSEWGKKVILSELKWIGIPSLILIILFRLFSKRS